MSQSMEAATTDIPNRYTAPKFVYFLRPTGLDGPIKIGCSWGPIGRAKKLSEHSPWPLELIGMVRGDYADERFLQRCFADCHWHREWFHPTPALMEMISKILECGSIEPARSTLVPTGDIKGPVIMKRAARRIYRRKQL